ncbi:tandem-95 repeat protein, partial [Vogesella sp. AC12]|uniref:tandem-95 repeat protein n=1 Tax=Vogesella sp. AC12 TaxID=2950550 RepID=UPI00210B8292
DGVGSLQLNADGSYVFTPAANYHGAVPLVSYTVSDGVSSDSSTLSISVTPVDDKGVAGIDSNTTLEDTAVSGNVLDNDRDIDSNLTVAGFSVDINGDGTTESFTAGQTATINGVGTLTLGSDGGYIFAPAGNWSGAVPAVTYTTNTGTSATLNIDVTPVADKPALTINNYQTVASMNFEDVALPSQGYSETIQINTISGTSTVGTWSTWNGSGYVEVGKEGIYQGGSSSNKVMEIEAATGDKTLYADIQVEAGRFYELDFDVAARNGHIASSGMSVSLVKLDASGNPVTGSSVVLYTFSPTDSSWHNVTENWTAEASGTYRLIFTSTDSGNSYGALLDNITFSAVENKGYENSFFSLGDINTALTDTDGSEELAVEISGLPVGAVLKDGAGHELTVGANGKLDVTGWSLTTLQIQVDQPGNYTLTVTSTSSEVVNGSVVDSDSSQASFTITVLDAANFTDANEVVTMAEDGVLSGSVLTGTSSIEGAVTVSSFSIGGSSYTAGQTATVANIGALKVNADGSYVFTPVKDFNGPVPTVNYVVTDGKTTDASTLDITVTAVEDTPVSYSSGNSGAYWLMNYTSNANEFDMKVKNGTMTLAVGESLHWDILVTDSDQNATLTLINKSLPSGATLSSERLYAENGEVMLRVYLTVTGNSAITLSQDNQFTIDVNGASGKALLINSDEYVGVHPNNEYDYSTQFDNGNASQWDDTDWLSSNVRGGELATSSSSQAGQTVSYGNGEDIVYGTTGGDSLSGGADNDFIDGRAGNDTLHGDTGNDVVLGGHGNDTLYGDAGNDYLDGGRGSDALYGGSGNDVLKGGADSDTLVGGAGNDTLTGGTGIDTFKWTLGDAGAVGSAARDSITDFKAGVGGDVLDLKDLLQGENSSNLSNYLHFDKDAAGNAVVQISSSGNVVGGFDQAITLEGVKLSDLGAGDANIINNLLANGNLKVDL